MQRPMNTSTISQTLGRTHVRHLLSSKTDVAEQRMFGGLAFLLAGHMAVAVSGQGGVGCCDVPAEATTLLSRPARVTHGDVRS